MKVSVCGQVSTVIIQWLNPYKKDILGELVKAYNDEGIDVHFYFSVMDWSHPDYRYDIKSKDDEVALRVSLNLRTTS